MVIVVHVPESGLSNAKPLLELARGADAAIIDGDGESFRFSLEPGRMIRELLRSSGAFD